MKCKLALEKLSAKETLVIYLDKGEPEVMIKKALKEMKYLFKTIEEDQKTIKLKCHIVVDIFLSLFLHYLTSCL